MSPSPQEKYLLRQNPWYQAAVGSAIVACVFTGVVILLLGNALYHLKVTDPRRADALMEMKQQYESQPADEALMGEIRRMDQEIRRDRFARLQLIRFGVVLLLVFMAILIGSLLWIKSYYSGGSLPDRPAMTAEQQVRRTAYARGTVTLSLILLAGLGLYAVLRPQPQEKPHAAQEPQGQVLTETSRPIQFASMEETQKQWPVFRGPGGLGISPFDDVPVAWDGPSGQNILWKTPVPLPGHNSPVVWNNRIFLTGADEEKRQVFCFDADSGRLLWTGDVPASSDPALKDLYIMEDTGYAASTAAVNGFFVAAIFVDGQVGCFDLEGNLRWVKSLGIPESAYGYASSLTFFEDRLIVQFDQTFETQKSRLIALDFASGDILWRTPRPVPNSWTSPTVTQIGDSHQILTSGSPWVIGYDPKTGEELWKVECIGGDVAPTQVALDGRVFAVEPYSVLAAVDPAADESARLLWKAEGDMPDICSPLAFGGLIWTLTTQGDLFCFDIADGGQVYAQKLEGSYLASPSLAAGRLYLLNQAGRMTIAEAGRTFTQLAQNELGEKTFASPAFAPGRIYLRGSEHLYCIGAAPEQ